MISIHRGDVPPFLKNSSLYPTLDSEDKEAFEVPSTCFKKDTCIQSMTDLEVVLNSIRYWGVSQFPVTIVSFLVHHNAGHHHDHLLSTFPEYKNFLNNVQKVGSSLPDEVVSAAIKAGLGVTATRHLHQRDLFYLSPCAYVAAAERDDLPSMKYLHDNGCQWHEKTISTAIQRGSLRCLRYAYDHMRNSVLPPDCMQMAAAAGRISVMQLLHKLGIPYDKHVYIASVNLAVVKHLRSSGCAWATHHCSLYAARNMLDCMIFANAHGSRWSPHTAQAAAFHGHTNILQYLHTHGCPWDAYVTYNAAQKGHSACLKYALSQGCPCTWSALYAAVTERRWMCIVHLLRYRYGGQVAGLLVALVFSLVCMCYFVMCVVQTHVFITNSQGDIFMY